MSQASEAPLPPVLRASVHDVRYFATLLRAVNFVNRATFTVTERGLTIAAEEARTLLGTAFIFSDIFDEYSYQSNALESGQSQDSDEVNVGFEIPLNTLIECLNIFGTAGAPPTNTATKYKKWKRSADDSNDEDEGGRDKRGKTPARGLDAYFSGGSERRTGMRMTYAGPGSPLILLLAEDATGPTTTCEITTFEFEPHLELPFDASRIVLKVILKSSWLRDALSELDPSFDKLTFIGSAPPEEGGSTSHQKQRVPVNQKPMFRLQAGGTFGSVEMDYPNDREVLETFECRQNIRVRHIRAHNEDGLLSLQFLMPSPKGGAGASNAFIEFRCLALDDEG
ncbi:hypothetical protein H0H92_011892 [Tricholoma furcatifolium]|nr:hypothetical protein H0H92_011892 [Tricholoma furcatifolium]